jgi:transglutaminase-like putative cysteine protease
MSRHLPRAMTALALPALILLPAVSRGDASPAGVLAAPRTLTTQFTYKATVPEVPSGAKSLDLWLPLPSDNAYQTIRDVKVDSPTAHRINRETKYGNRMVYVHLDNPTAPVNVTVQFTVDRKEAVVLGADSGTAANLERGREALNPYLQADKNVPLGGRYGAIAVEVAGSKATPLDKARALYEHVVANMQYDYKKESPKLGEGDVAFVCDYKKGNCSDLHSYLISLSRSLQIPAYLEYGFPVTGIPVDNPLKKEGTVGGYHCWTWVHDEKYGWLPIDASDGRRWLDSNRPDVKERMFGNLVLERSAVAFSRGRDLTLVPAQKAGPLNYFIYPYAESDGTPTKATWEVRYVLPNAGAAVAAPAGAQLSGGQDLQRQIDELRRLVTQQAEEIAKLKGTTATAKAPVPVTTASREQAGFYGFVRLDGIADSAQTNNIQIPFFVQSPSNPNVAGRDNGQATMHPRLTRLGFNLAAPPDTLKGTKVTGKFEMDFQNGQGVTTESRPLPRIRHAYLQLQNGASSWLFGQTWDLISPLFPSPNDDTLQWNAGNLGDRRAQIRFTQDDPASPFSGAVALGLTGALDAKDLDANGIRDGEDSFLPNVQARAAWKNSKGAVGISGHLAWEDLTKPVAGRTHFRSYSVGLDLLQRIATKWDLKGELWMGSNLSDFRGGIGQGVNAATGSEIRSHGGWLEVGYLAAANQRVAIGYTEDNPTDRDIPAGGRLKNYSLYLHDRIRLSGNVEVGANYLYWLTRWNGLATGIDHRLNAFIQHNF